MEYSSSKIKAPEATPQGPVSNMVDETGGSMSARSQTGVRVSGADATEFGTITAFDVMVCTRDGVRLATDVHWPAINGERAPGVFPTILGRTSYDKSNAWLWVDPVVRQFVPRGYVVVVQDIRGRYNSEGEQYYHTANPWEGADGYDTVEWIARQEWSNGRVGMVGSSHNAIVQHVAALERPPHLTAIWPDVGPTNIFAHEAREGGAMSLQMFGALFMHAYQDRHADDISLRSIEAAMSNMSELVCQTPFKRGQTALSHFPCLEKTLFDYYLRGAYDEWWAQACCNQEPYWEDHADIPAVFSGGWFDPFSAGTTKYFSTMAHKNQSRQRLIMGPWTHDSIRRGGSVDGDVDFGADAAWGPTKYPREQLRWFDRWLRDRDTGVEKDSPVSIFVMGSGDGHKTSDGYLSHGGYWREETEWPIERGVATTYILTAGGTLTTDSCNDDQEHAISYSADPAHPVPTIGGNIASFYEMVDVPGVEPGKEHYVPWYVRMRNIVPAGPFDQRESRGMVAARSPFMRLATRSDVLVFQTDILMKQIEITGSCLARLWISSDALDSDVTLKLVDVYPASADYPEGYDMNLVDTARRLRYRNGYEHEQLMTPEGVYEVEVELPPTSNVFKAGHRLRLDIAGSNFPRFDINPNTGEPVGRHTHDRVAHNTIHTGPGHPSRLIVPLIPA